MKLLGLAGKSGAGKDTLANELTEKYGFIRVGFADALKESLLALDPVIPTVYGSTTINHRLSYLVRMHGWEKTKRTEPEVRRLLQVFGTEVGRAVLGKDAWVHVLDRKLQDMMHSDTKVVVADVRFRNEAEYIRGWGGTVVRVDRPEYEEAQGHISERVDHIPVDHVIYNTGNVKQLVDKAEELANMAKGRER